MENYENLLSVTVINAILSYCHRSQPNKLVKTGTSSFAAIEKNLLQGSKSQKQTQNGLNDSGFCVIEKLEVVGSKLRPLSKQ